MTVSTIYFVEKSFFGMSPVKLAAAAQVLNRCSGRSILKMCTLCNGYGYMLLIQTYKYQKGWQ